MQSREPERSLAGPAKKPNFRPALRGLLSWHRHAARPRGRRESRALDVSFRDQAIASLYTPADNRLEGFYIPALKQAVRYDRVTGYYRSSSLVVAAAGVSRFVANGGTMRIIAGTELDELTSRRSRRVSR